MAVCARIIIAGVLGLALGGPRASAQPRHDHSAQIEAVLGQLGGGRDLARASETQLSQLYSNLMSRGQYLLDLHALDRDLVLELTTQRDSIGRAGGAVSPSATYYLARALHEAGRVREAAAAYARVSSSAPARLRADAAAWSAVLAGRGGNSWQQKVTDWRQGKPVEPVTCGADAAPGCAIVQALIVGEAPALLRLVREYLARSAPEQVDTLRGKTGTFQVEFHDPAIYALLGWADFLSAARILQGRSTLDAFRGVALVRAGRSKDALTAFGTVRTDQPSLAVLLGEAQYVSGDRAAAEQTWRRVTGSMGLNMLADSRSLAAGDAAPATRQFDAEAARQFRVLRTPDSAGSYLARALLRAGKPEAALQVMRAVRPLSVTPSLDRVPPLVPVLTAHALYRLGRVRGEQSRYIDALTELQPISTFGGAPRVYRMLQQVSVPAASSGDVRGLQ